MKKEYLILVILILALSGYLFFKKDNQRHYTLPELPVIEAGKIDRIKITQKKNTIELIRNKDQWTVTEKAFPADKTAVDSILDVVRHLTLSALISDKGTLLRYELDPDHAITVQALKGSDTLITFKIGKLAPSFNHTFVMVGDDPNIYQADKGFRSDFNKSVDELRDRQVLTFNQADIEKITLEKEGKVLTLQVEKTKDDKKKPVVTWKGSDNRPVVQDTVKTLLSDLSDLTCDGFEKAPEKKKLEKRSPLCKITLETGHADQNVPIVLSIFTGEDKDLFPAMVSTGPDSFILGSFTGKNILSHVDKLAGIEKKKLPKTDSDQ